MERKQAKLLGLKLYNTERPCIRGHFSNRRTNNASCISCEPLSSKEKYQSRKKKHGPTLKEKLREWKKSNPAGYLLNKVKYSSKHRGFEFNITAEDILVPEFCPVFGTRLDTFHKDNGPSVDRTDNTKGYIKGNVDVISILRYIE